ncbi:MAG: nitrous oxide reductase family maturation protein NosD [Bacteroidetes bacterium]|nr:nitrous oxide reductase family maturation protein NosD [Bacteroidota bacterium]MBU2505366.1 nitrous oxide reductase family maturation protein NosD [Bacteroidota bacterium]
MNKIFESILVFSLLGLFLTDYNCASITVGKNRAVTKIKDAVSSALPGDTIFVESGLYAEGNIIIRKPIYLIGLNFPEVSGEGNNEIFTIKGKNITITGFKLSNAGISFIDDNAAIKLDSSNHCSVYGNVLTNNFFGIYLARSTDCVIKNNTIEAFHSKESFSGNGIHVWYSKNILIESNTISGHRDGIYFEFVESSNIKRNVSFNNLRYGLHFMFSDSCSYSGNAFYNNNAGVAVMYTKNVDMHNNTFEKNYGGAAYGILLKEISDSKIHKNTFANNSSALYLEGCNRLEIKNNNFTGNGRAIRLMANSMDNKIIGNNFIGNTFDVTTNSLQNFNLFESNYWSDYSGYDLNKDNYGDIPHRPVKLFSTVIEKNKPALILMRSFFVEILELAEKIFPSITPEFLADSKPSMRKISN